MESYQLTLAFRAWRWRWTCTRAAHQSLQSFREGGRCGYLALRYEDMGMLSRLKLRSHCTFTMLALLFFCALTAAFHMDLFGLAEFATMLALGDWPPFLLDFEEGSIGMGTRG